MTAMQLARERERQSYAMAAREYAGHELQVEATWRGGAFYQVGLPGSSVYLSQICVGTHVTVQGDISLVSFAGGPRDPRARLHWLSAASGQYLIEKAHIGTQCDEAVLDVDVSVMRAELTEMRRSRVLSTEAAAAGWKAMKRACGGGWGWQREVQQALYEAGADSEAIFELGAVIAHRVVYAHVAVRALTWLLEGRRA